jgi:acyl-coenzyme A thioesterase PaaI-like protein
MVDVDALGAALLGTVPFARTLGIVLVDVVAAEDGRIGAVALLPDADGLHNHVGGPHAGALFALGETATGAVVLATFGDQLGRAVPLAVRADIRYAKLAMGDARATAVLHDDPAAVVAALDAGERPEFAVDVEISRPDGAVTATMTVVWTLRPTDL